MTLAEVRAAVEGVVRVHLGRYSNGDVAISTGEPPSDLRVEGIEAVIDPLPQLSATPTAEASHVTREWTVRLIDHEPGGADLLEPLEALLTRWPFAIVDPLVSSPDLGLDPQISIRIPDRIRVGYPRR